MKVVKGTFDPLSEEGMVGNVSIASCKVTFLTKLSPINLGCVTALKPYFIIQEQQSFHATYRPYRVMTLALIVFDLAVRVVFIQAVPNSRIEVCMMKASLERVAMGKNFRKDLSTSQVPHIQNTNLRNENDQNIAKTRFSQVDG